MMVVLDSRASSPDRYETSNSFKNAALVVVRKRLAGVSSSPGRLMTVTAVAPGGGLLKPRESGRASKDARANSERFTSRLELTDSLSDGLGEFSACHVGDPVEDVQNVVAACPDEMKRRSERLGSRRVLGKVGRNLVESRRQGEVDGAQFVDSGVESVGSGRTGTYASSRGWSAAASDLCCSKSSIKGSPSDGIPSNLYTQSSSQLLRPNPAAVKRGASVSLEAVSLRAARPFVSSLGKPPVKVILGRRVESLGQRAETGTVVRERVSELGVGGKRATSEYRGGGSSVHLARLVDDPQALETHDDDLRVVGGEDPEAVRCVEKGAAVGGRRCVRSSEEDGGGGGETDEASEGGKEGEHRAEKQGRDGRWREGRDLRERVCFVDLLVIGRIRRKRLVRGSRWSDCARRL